MMNQLKTALISKSAFYIAVIAILWGVNDFANRFISSENKVEQQTRISEFLPFVDVRLDNSVINRINANLKKYKNKTLTTIEKPKGLSKEEQLQQNGDLPTLFVDDNKLTLKAIIKSQSTHEQTFIALIKVTHIESNNSALERYADNADVYGYRMKIENNKQIILTKAETGQEVKLTMYSVKA